MNDVTLTPPKTPRWILVLRLLVDFAALLLLSMCGAIFVDFTHRLLGADPDALGIFAIGIQAALTVAVSSSFTKSGAAVLRRFLGGDAHHRSLVRFGLSVALFGFVFAGWKYVPGWLAQRYNTQGCLLHRSLQDCGVAGQQTSPAHSSAAKESTEHVPDNPSFTQVEVLRYYQRAVSMDPGYSVAHFNEGELLESLYRYDEAAASYEQAILTERRDAIDLSPYAALAELDRKKGQPLDALKIVADAQALKPDFDAWTRGALYRTKAGAEYDLGYYVEAVADAGKSETAAGTCVAAKAYEKLHKQDEAKAAWASFQKQHAAKPNQPPAPAPDCSTLAAEALP